MSINGVRCLVVDPSSALSDPALIIYNHWLQGHSIERAAQLLCMSELHTSTPPSNATAQPHPPTTQPNATTFRVSESILSLYRDEVQDAHRTFAVFEALLEQPNLLGVQSQIECPVDNGAQRQKLIALYYGFDSRVLREFMGVKLTSKLRSNLDDISEKTHVAIRSVRRQFDNLRRIISRFEEFSVFRGNNCQQIAKEFCLPSSLARRYAAASFLLYHRFDLETSDRKYQFLTWSDCEYMAMQLMAKWVTRPVLMMSRENSNAIDSMFGVVRPDQPNGGATTTVPSSIDDASWQINENTGEDTKRLQYSPSKNHAFKISTSPGNSSNEVLRSSSVPTFGTTPQPFSVSPSSTLSNASMFSSPFSNMHVDLPYGPSVSDIGFTASVDASGSKFALERRSSVDLAPAWLSDVRDMKTQMMGSSSTMDALVERVVGQIGRLGSKNSTTALSSSNSASMVPVALATGLTNSTTGTTTATTAADGAPMNYNRLRKVTKDVVRNMFVIGGNLSQAKELRDFFEDVIEKVCDPLLGLFYNNSGGGGGGSGGGSGSGGGGSSSSSGSGEGSGRVGSGGGGATGGEKEMKMGTKGDGVSTNHQRQTREQPTVRNNLGKDSNAHRTKTSGNNNAMNIENGVANGAKIFFLALFDASCESAPIKALSPINRRERLLSSWRRFLDVIGCCTLRMMRRRLRLMQG